MTGKKPSQDTAPPSISSDLDGAGARPASAPATRILPQRQGLHSPRVSSATQPSDSIRSSSANGQQRRGPEKQPVLLPDAAGGQNTGQAPPQQAAELQPSSPRGGKLRGGFTDAPGSASSRPTSGSKRLTRSDAEEAKAAAERQAEEDEELAEEALLERAAEIRKLRNSLARPMPAAPEPKRPKTHWDHLLEEMTWLAKEFQKERKWKLNMAKKYVRAVARSNLDLESRKNVRQKEAELAIRRKAAFIGKEVMQFWKKAERVMVYKRQSQLDARKKEAMDKHLSFLVDQTQKYSSLLAQRLGAAGEEVLALPAPQATPPPAQSQAVLDPAFEPSKPQVPVKAEGAEAQDAATISEDLEMGQPEGAAGPLDGVKAEPLQGSQDVRGLSESGADDEMDVSEGDLPKPGKSRTQAHRGLAALGQDQQAAEDDADDFKAESGSEEDDEATLEEEEALARDAGEESGNEGELAALADEADMPLDQLMALYGYVPGSDEPKEGSGQPEGQRSAEGKQPEESSTAAEQPEASTPAAMAMDVDSDDGAEGDPEAADEKPGRDLADLMNKEEGHEGDMDADYASAASEADDEATLEEEDALAAQDGLDQKEQDDAEVAALADEADMPLEQLLAMYGMVVDEDRAPETHGVADDSTKEPSGSGRARKRRRVASGAGASGAEQAAEQAGRKAAQEQAAGVSSKASAVPVTPAVAAPAIVPKGAAKGIASEDEAPSEEDHDQALAELEKVTDGKAKLEGVARLAEQAQPKGSTLDTASVHTPVPFLLKGSLREYQHVGLDWLVTIYTRRLNGILADEMGLGKTIMTIALLAHLACEKGVWGPHLIVVPTSVMLNWEVECKKWCPAFKLLTYYGSAKERKAKRQGWSKPNAFHICITSYTLVLQDAKMFRRKKWKYLILDEAHMIKNWKSQRWQTLLNFNSQRRLLITGTPLQNDLMELWSLMHFLMPQVFASHAQFKDWFSNPLTGMVEGQEAVNKVLVERLHSVLRPFLLRRLKRDVEKQLPGKHEHIIKCRLSKRQRTLYEDYMAASDVRSTLSSGNFLGIINVLMQLRKVCNHPDLFEGRSIISAFDMLPSISNQEPSSVLNLRHQNASSSICLHSNAASALHSMSAWEAAEVKALETPSHLIQERPSGFQSAKVTQPLAACMPFVPSAAAQALVQQSAAQLQERRWAAAADRRRLMALTNARRCSIQPLYGEDLIRAVHVDLPVHHVNIIKDRRGCHLDFCQAVADVVKTAAERAEEVDNSLKTFMFVIPKARAATPEIWCSRPDTSAAAEQQATQTALQQEWFQRSAPLRTAIVRQQVFFPDRRLIQFDCGKLQELAMLLRKLKSGGHKALIFTQMARMLDILEVFLNLHGYTYVRLDGTTKPEQRQILMQRYNTNPKLFIFILSTRSGGVGMNLTGADTVIFYDSDWNPAMDAQAQDRCHRIGQTREVHIYRLVSESTIEENILHKSDQKRQLDHLAIQSGGFNTDFLQKFNPRELLGIQAAAASADASTAPGGLSAEEMAAAMQSVEDETDQAAAQALQLETEAELAEFNADPVPKPLDPEGDEDDNDAEDTRDPEASGALEKPSLSAPASQPSTDLPLAKTEEEDADTMDDVAALAGHGKSQDALATLEGALRPVERYAVHFLEEQAAITMEVEAAAAAVEAELDAQEWNMQEIERIQEEQEAEIEDDVEATRVLDWDKAAADAAYRVNVEEAEQRQRLLQEQRAREEAAWLEQQEALLAMQAAMPVQPVYTRVPTKKLWTPELDGAESQQYSPYPRFSRKRARTARGRMVVRPRWPGEDTTPSASHDDSDAYSSPDEASPRTGGRAKRHHSMLSPQSLRQRSRLADGSPGGSVIKQEVSDSYTPEQPGANGAADIPRPYNAAPQYPPIGQLRTPAHVWLPWDVLEDVVLATMVEDCQAPQLSPGAKSVPAAVWQLISDALSAGAATLSTTAAAAASQPMKMRSVQQCRDRYEMLLAAFHDSLAQLPSPASRAGGPLAAQPQAAPPGASPAGQAQVASLSLVPPPSSQALAAAAAADSISAGLSRPGPPAQNALAQRQVVLSAAGTSPGPGVHSSTPLHTVAAGASPQPLTGQHLAPVSTPQQSATPVPPSSAQQTQQQQQLSTTPYSSTVPAPGAAASGQGSGQASLPVGRAYMHAMQPRMGAAWSLSSELQTLREHLAWLASSNIVCGIAGISAVTSAATMGGQMPAEGSAVAEVLVELQSLPRNGQLRGPGTAGPKQLHRSSLGTPVQGQPLLVVQADAAAVRSAVVISAGAPSRGVLRHLNAVVSAVRTSGVHAGNAALRQLLQMPRHPPIAASSGPQQPQQLRPQQPQQMGVGQQQPLPGSASGPHSAIRPVRGPMPGQACSAAGHSARAALPGQPFGQRPSAQGLQPQAGRPGLAGATLPQPMRPGAFQPQYQGSQAPGQTARPHMLRPQPLQQPGAMPTSRPGIPGQQALPAYLRPALMQQMHQVVGQMQTAAGGAPGGQQPNLALIPGLQALLAQQASSTPVQYAGQATTSQSQQHNLALLHSLLSHAHSAGLPAGAGRPGMFSAGQPGQHQLLGLGMRPPGQQQWPAAGAARPGLLQVPMHGMSQLSQHGRPGLTVNSLGGASLPMQPNLTSAPRPGMSAAVQAAPAQASGVQQLLRSQLPGQAPVRATRSAPHSQGSDQGRSG